MKNKLKRVTIATLSACMIANAVPIPGNVAPSLTVGKIKMATNPVNMGSVAVFYFVTICAIL